MALAYQHEQEAKQGSMSDCFKEDQWRRTLVAGMSFFIQNATGMGWVIGYMSYFMQLAGMAENKSFDATVGISAVMVVGNLCGWVLIEWLGRRGTILYGCMVLCVSLLIIGILAVVESSGALIAQVVLMGVWAFGKQPPFLFHFLSRMSTLMRQEGADQDLVYQATAGAAAWPISAENATSRLRTPTQSICTMVNALSASIWGLSLPYAVNPDEGNLGGKIAFIYAGLLVLSIVFIFFFIPETKGRTYAEIDELWQRKVAPRHFAKHKLIAIEVSEKSVD